ncbi:heat shock protein 30 [Oryzias melastigma]|uniref:heat shock protein 30 n=1 Tax=Oryzias melastigma TaxID=30732 RepID=UPI000CF7CC27|nr:heat shock protein 30 [Oryzias melastigma]
MTVSRMQQGILAHLRLITSTVFRTGSSSFSLPVRLLTSNVVAAVSCSSLKLMNTFQHILEEAEPLQSSVALQPVSFQLDKDEQHFGLTLDTAGFSPEELSVRQVGRKLRVSGKTEKKQEDGKGSYSHRLQEFRQELDLPEGLNPEAVTCCLSPDGKLHIQAVKEEADRELSIKRSWEEEPQQRVFTDTRQHRLTTHHRTNTTHGLTHTFMGLYDQF